MYIILIINLLIFYCVSLSSWPHFIMKNCISRRVRLNFILTALVKCIIDKRCSMFTKTIKNSKCAGVFVSLSHTEKWYNMSWYFMICHILSYHDISYHIYNHYHIISYYAIWYGIIWYVMFKYDIIFILQLNFQKQFLYFSHCCFSSKLIFHSDIPFLCST